MKRIFGANRFARFRSLFYILRRHRPVFSCVFRFCFRHIRMKWKTSFALRGWKSARQKKTIGNIPNLFIKDEETVFFRNIKNMEVFESMKTMIPDPFYAFFDFLRIFTQKKIDFFPIYIDIFSLLISIVNDLWPVNLVCDKTSYYSTSLNSDKFILLGFFLFLPEVSLLDLQRKYWKKMLQLISNRPEFKWYS